MAAVGGDGRAGSYTFAIMNSFLLLRYLYFSHGTAIPEASVSTAGSVLSAVYLPLLITLILTTGFLEHKLSANVTNLMDGLRAVAGGDYSVRLKTDKHQLLDDLCEDFNRMTEELQSVRTLREDFVNSYSHEFKTPLISIRGFAKLLQNPDLSAEQRATYAGTIARESERLAAMSTHILELTQYENTEIVSGKTLYSLDEQLRRCIHQQERSWLQKGLTVEGDLDRVDYYGNEELVEHIWSNLIANAIRFTPAGGQITVVLRREPGAVSVAVSDTGIGMDAETQRHIFDKFYRGEQGSDSRGNGLGLSIVRRAVELCGGTVEVFSRPGEGATFTVTLGMEDRGGGKERGFQGAK